MLFDRGLLFFWSSIVVLVTSSLDHGRLRLLEFACLFLLMCLRLFRRSLFLIFRSLVSWFLLFFAFFVLFAFEPKLTKLFHLLEFHIVNFIVGLGGSDKMKIAFKLLLVNLIIFVLVFEDSILYSSDHFFIGVDFVSDEFEERRDF